MLDLVTQIKISFKLECQENLTILYTEYNSNAFWFCKEHTTRFRKSSEIIVN